MIWIAITVLVIVYLIATVLKKQHTNGEYKRTTFLSPAEKGFLRSLDSAVGSKYRIFAKVRLVDIITPSSGNRSDWQAHFNRVSAKHVDFLLCGLDDGEPICAIELDDSTHLATNRVARDNFLNHALQSAGISIARFQARGTYHTMEIKNTIDAAIPKTFKMPKAPTCPKCGKSMILRTTHAGPRSGQQFWGCTGYPLCTAVVKINPLST